ncbi:hypothetical protein ACFY2Q_25750 [Micromonospora sp. NPDC000316]|uniref:hypothetical protein n=1 Tax=Micromonospora sp. NPDC000316 TaxID=3364216 RepID=UPI00367C6A07
MRSGRTALTVALLGVALSGCVGSGTSPNAQDDPGPAQIVERWTSCAEAAPHAGTMPIAPPAPGRSASPAPRGLASPAPQGSASPALDAPAVGRIDSAFTPVTAVLCGGEIRPRPGGGREQVATERRADEIGSLTAALRLPDQRADGEAVCTLDLLVPPWLALLDDRGRWLRPYLPADSCGKPRREVRAALDGLRLTTVDSRTVREIESAAAEAAGCGQRWADMVWVETTVGRPGPLAPGAVADAGPLRLCVYRVSPAEQGGVKPAGDFAYGGALPPDRQASVVRALATTRPATHCVIPASRFAVLRPMDGGGRESYVELDGCRRVMVVPPSGGPRLGQGDAALAALLGPV